MKFSFRITVFGAAVILLLLLYTVWQRNRSQTAFASEKDVAYRTVRKSEVPNWHLYSSVRPSTVLSPIHTTASLPGSNVSGAYSASGSQRLIQLSNADINTLGVLEVVDRERRYGIRASETAPPELEEVAEGLPLKVIVIPHSHSDPGWHKTVDGYFEEQTKQTLDNMLDKLQLYPNMTFVWAESVFLSMWWKQLSHNKRIVAINLIKKGQLEIVGGSWVVPDEANTHYFALIDQMIEGHQWVKDNIGIYPSNTWSLDPFGYSSVLAHLYKLAGFENMVILRVHTDVKHYLQSRYSLEFMWCSMWNCTKSEEIMTLMMPYMLYNIKHSCGPDPNVCILFDFRKISGEMSESRAVMVHSGNVDRLAKLLLRQYRLKAKLFRHNVVLVPLGDDFRYDRDIEWDQQFKNYMRLFKYMNSKTEWNVHARFGTVKDYFEEVKLATAKLYELEPTDGKFPSLAGDFFPYTDHSDEFWTGYFSTRPFPKCLCRDLEVFLRSAEILHSLALGLDANGLYESNMPAEKLVISRRSLALFQHHDGITGTSRFWVAEDYEHRLEHGLQMSKDVMHSAVGFLLSNRTSSDTPVNVLDPLSVRMLSPNEHLIHVTRTGVRLQVFNNIAHRRHELIHLIVNNQHILVVDYTGSPLVSQITPAPVESSDDEEMLAYMLSFIADLPPLSITAFDILPSQQSSVGCSQIANSTEYAISHLTKRQDILFENAYIKTAFSINAGLLIAVQMKESKHIVQSSLQFLLYTSHRSGAYIFAPAGSPDKHADADKSLIRVFSGPLFTEVRFMYSFGGHWARVIHCKCPLAAAIELNTIVDMTSADDKELILRLTTDIKSGSVFYTDQNGFQVMKRRRFSSFPIEANYYPATSAVFVEDDRHRVSLLMLQPCGASSQGEGSLEVMLDRRMQTDDNRGLGEGVLDNKRVFYRHYLLFESVAQKPTLTSHIMPMPTLLAHTLIHQLRNQPILILSSLASNYAKPIQLLRAGFPCDTVLVNLRVLNGTKSSALILHRVGYSTAYDFSKSSSLLECSLDFQSLNIYSLFMDIKFRFVTEKTLSLMHTLRRQVKDSSLHLQPMQLRTFQVYF